MDAATTDDLTRPLGLDRPARRRLPRLRLPVARLLASGLLLASAALGAYVGLVEDPLGGEPHALVPIAARPAPPPPREAVASGHVKEVPDGGNSRRTATASELESASGVAVVRGEGQGAPSAVMIRVPGPEVVRLQPAPDPRLVERSRYGLLPKVGPDGARPAAAYARPAAAALAGGGRPVARVALLVGGLGIGQTATADAIAKLPPAVTLAFAPYGGQIEANVARAREDGHEVMLQVPMEPFDYPDNDPGPHTLTAAGKTQENLDKLHWVMGRFAGYTGLVNFMGAKITADEAALAPILREASARGLVVLDDGTSSRSVMSAVGAGLRAPTARADVVLDAVPRADAVDGALARLEEIARGKQGFAIGTATALPMTVERIARWSRALEARGILLVPVSAAFDPGRS